MPRPLLLLPLLLLLLPLLLAACKTQESPQRMLTSTQQAQEAVTHYLHTNFPEADRYQPARFRLERLTRADSAQWQASQLFGQSATNMHRWKRLTTLPQTLATTMTIQRLQARNDSIEPSRIRLGLNRDTTQVGWRVTHDYAYAGEQSAVAALWNHPTLFFVFQPGNVVVVPYY